MRDPELVAALYKEHFDPVRRRAQAITRCPHAAQDVAQDALLATFAHLDRLDHDAVGPYATTVARRTALRQRVLVAEPADQSQEDHVSAVVLRDHVRGALSALPERQRQAMFLHLYADRPNDEIGAALGLNANATGQLLHRARRSLQSSLEAS
ncbi:sigma-70 family RNA polymerase sigma factor [Solirubrobacter phytolaccae]|uniref:Sigma-70 family RNA polymerase sigma factor n=1 Tax=Solirubrobacter phytolaccae TaxID=1404360 RepID=A0A9X3N738_9ACTN|nr:sigma-70 family RNA polymerase sigma factor [Solirubrobacter phytolaccae]MDA0181075.1 sigma-70 family RNA polymerase sigma factor [Solirubrobacter phytolaccae]